MRALALNANVSRVAPRTVALLALAATLALAQPPSAAPANPLHIQFALARVGSGASLNLASVGKPGARPNRYIRLDWTLRSHSPEAISIIGAPSIVEAVGQGGRDLLTSSHVRVDPWPTRLPAYSEAGSADRPIGLNFGATFEHDGPMPRVLERVTLEIDVAARGAINEFGLSATPSHDFVLACEGVEARVAAVGRARHGSNQEYAIVEYRLAPATPLEIEATDPSHPPLTPEYARPAFEDHAELVGAFHAPLLASAAAVCEAGVVIGEVAHGLETATTTGRLGVMVVHFTREADLAAIRLHVNPAAEVRRYRLTAQNIDTGG